VTCEKVNSDQNDLEGEQSEAHGGRRLDVVESGVSCILLPAERGKRRRQRAPSCPESRFPTSKKSSGARILKHKKSFFNHGFVSTQARCLCCGHWSWARLFKLRA